MNTGPGAGERRLADYMRRVGEIQARAEETQAQLKALRAHVTSPDRVVTVEMAPGGRLERLTLSQDATRYGPQQLAAVITETIRRGHAEVAEQMQDTMRPLIGDSPAMEFLRDQIDIAQQDEDDEPAAPDDGRIDGEMTAETDEPPAPPQRPHRPPRPTEDDEDDDGPFRSVWGDR
ncbi:YbaB/EbfC family nucleoid-associated protein [Actinophytocola gossypii]|nr:YbaB/EbfC family nucleoid-associated protein [Actinophytocola gossypii]